MRSNGLLKWLMIPMVLLLVFVGMKLLSGDRGRSTSTTQGSALTPDEAKALGVDGDSPRDTVATLVAQVKQLRGELQTALTENKDQKTENDRLRQREGDIDRRIQTALEGEHNRLQQERERMSSDQQQTQGLLQDLQRRLDGLGGKGGSADLPIGLGLEDGDGESFADETLHWTEPSDVKPAGSKNAPGAAFQSEFTPAVAPAQKALESTGDTVVDAGRKAVGLSTTRAVYTVPSNATLMGSIAMTALIGRVPVDGTVNDPFPFKVLIGRDNLTANGIELPDVAGAVVGGTASGDWTLSCVRGQIRSITFVFEDGTVRTVPDDAQGQRGGSENALGWISDPYGIPCVSGERRSNAAQYLGSQALITAAGAGAASLIRSKDGSVAVVSNGNGSLGTVGISGNEAMDRILAGGVQDMSQWVNKLYGQAFAAVYVQPGAKVALHIEQPLAIDYDTAGRRVDHRVGGKHVPNLD